MKQRILLAQVLPLSLTLIVAGVFTLLVYGEINLLNTFTATDISTKIRWVDVGIGFTIYLKTSIDFAIFMGGLMQKNTGWKSRIAIEIGTAAGNAIGTMTILLVWTFFKEVEWLLALMIIVAALVLITLAEDGLEHAKAADRGYPAIFKKTVSVFERFLRFTNLIARPIVSRVLPGGGLQSVAKATFWSLMSFAFLIPFILGLDDFAGYVPLFSLVNIYGFCIGVFFAHALLNALLYLSPERTIRAVKNPVISLVGSMAFIGLAGLGIYEAAKLLFGLH